MFKVAADSTSLPALGLTAAAYWSLDPTEVAKQFQSTSSGLSGEEATRRLRTYGPNETRERRELSRLDVLSRQLRSPLLLLLVFAAIASLLAGEWLDAAIVMIIVIISVAIGYSREYSAQTAAAALGARIRTRCTVVRDGHEEHVPIEDVVPGDLMLLSAGSLVPADAVILESTDFFVSEAVLTGESLPVHKAAGALDADAELHERGNCVFLGTNVRSGSARCLIVKTGAATEFGGIAHRLTLRPPETEFDRGIRHFGYLLTTAMLIMVLAVFVGHMFAGRPPVETLLFSVALAVGLSPELLPAILSVNPSDHLSSDAGVVSHGLVRRIPADGVGHRAGCPNTPAVVSESTREGAPDFNDRAHRGDVRDTLSAVCRSVWFRAVAGRARGRDLWNHVAVCRNHRADEAPVVSDVSVMRMSTRSEEQLHRTLHQSSVTRRKDASDVGEGKSATGKMRYHVIGHVEHPGPDLQTYAADGGKLKRVRRST